MDLAHELGGTGRAASWLVKVVERFGKPIAVNAGDETIAVAPSNWSQGRLTGYLAVHRGPLEAVFGEIDRMTDVR